MVSLALSASTESLFSSGPSGCFFLHFGIMLNIRFSSSFISFEKNKQTKHFLEKNQTLLRIRGTALFALIYYINFQEMQLIRSNRKQISGFLGMEQGWQCRKEKMKCLLVMNIFIMLIVVITSSLYTYVKTTNYILYLHNVTNKTHTQRDTTTHSLK